MNKKIPLLLFALALATQIIYAKSDKKLAKKNMRAAVAKCCGGFEPVEPVCCKRGKRGNRGPRGPRGRDASGGLNEFFVNGAMMNSFVPQEFFNLPYSVDSSTLVWRMLPSTADPSDISPIGVNFDVPIDLDVTQPVTVVVHFFVTDDPDQTGDQAKIQVSVDYQATNQVLGSTPPATGYADIQVSPDFTVVLAQPLFSGNLRQQSVAISLDPSQIDGDWAFMAIERVAPAANEYSRFLYLTTVSVQYTRLSS